MKIVELLKIGSIKPFAVIGLLEGNIFLKGLDEDYYREWLDNGVEDKDGMVWRPSEGLKFLEAIVYKLSKTFVASDIKIRGPFSVDIVPELEEIKEDDKREIDGDFEDLKETKGGE